MKEHPDVTQGPRSSWLVRLPAYPLLLSMRTCSSVILWVDFTLIFSLLSYHWQVEASTIGIASALYGLPGLMLGPLFGRLADHHSPFKLLYLSYLARGLTSLLLIFTPSTEVFLVLVFCKGLGNLGAMPTEQVLVRVLLSQNQIISNASLTTAIDQISKICAPLIGALLAQWFHPEAGFGLSALLALFGLVLLYLLQRCYQPLAKKMTERTGAAIGALFVLLRRDTIFRMAFYATVTQSLVLGLYDPLLVLMLKIQGYASGTFGIIVSCTATGAISGAMLFHRFYLGQGGLRLMALALSGFGATVLVPGALTCFGQPIPLYLMLVLWLANGCCYALGSMSFGVMTQTHCRLEEIGTVTASARSAQLLALVIGPLAGAALSSVSSLQLVFVLSGSMALLWGASLWKATRLSLPEPRAK